MVDVTRKFLPMILLGDSKVGKTSLSLFTINNKFSENSLSTIGKDVHEKKVTIEGHSIKIKIHDTAGQERYKSIALNTLRIALGIILVYSIDDRVSFDSLDRWVEDINNADHGKPIILVGNKSDLEEKRVVTYEEGEEYAKKKGFNFYECSAKDGTNVNKAFDDIIFQMYKKHEKEFESDSDGNIQIRKSINKKQNKKKC